MATVADSQATDEPDIGALLGVSLDDPETLLSGEPAAPPAPEPVADASPPAPGEPAPAPTSPAPTPAAPVASPASPTAQPTESARDQFRKLTGHDASSYKTDDEFYRGVAQLQQHLRSRDEDSQLGRWLRERPEEAFAELQKQVRPAATAGTGVAASPAADAQPEFDPSWATKVKLNDETGLYESKPGHDPSIGHKYNRANEWAAEQQRLLLFDREKALAPYLSKLKAELAAETRQSILAELQATDSQRAQLSANEKLSADIGSIIQSHAKDIYVNGDYSRREFTPYGQVFMQQLQRAQQIGITDLHAGVEYAADQARAKLGTAAPAAPATANGTAPAAAAKKPTAAAPAAKSTADEWPTGLRLEDALAAALRQS